MSSRMTNTSTKALPERFGNPSSLSCVIRACKDDDHPVHEQRIKFEQVRTAFRGYGVLLSGCCSLFVLEMLLCCAERALIFSVILVRFAAT